MSKNTMTKNGTVAEYNGYNWVATYPCGHALGLLIKTGGRFHRAWWRCPLCNR